MSASRFFGWLEKQNPKMDLTKIGEISSGVVRHASGLEQTSLLRASTHEVEKFDLVNVSYSPKTGIEIRVISEALPIITGLSALIATAKHDEKLYGGFFNRVIRGTSFEKSRELLTIAPSVEACHGMDMFLIGRRNRQDQALREEISSKPFRKGNANTPSSV